MKRVLVAGGSGFLGRAIGKQLKGKGYEVSLIGRTASDDCLSWDQVKAEGIPDSEAVIQLAGANIFDSMWTQARKEELRSSRIDTTLSLVDAMQKNPPANAFVCANAIGIYPHDTGEVMTEHTELEGEGVVCDGISGDLYEKLPFAQALCREWEAAAFKAQSAANVKTTVVRIPLALGKEGGALKSMLWPFWFGLGGPIGSGTQSFAWAHVDDVARVFVEAATRPDAKGGKVNVTAKEKINQAEFANALGKAMGRPAFMPMPSFAVKLLFQDRSDLLLGDIDMESVTLQDMLPGFEYKYDKIDDCLAAIMAE